MTIARSQQVDVSITPYYHCVSRCVRRSFLCGVDSITGKSYEHRQRWVEQRIQQLAVIYCIDVCSYAVMSNHYHLVVHINREKALSLSNREVIMRWSREHQLHPLIVRYLSNDKLNKSSLDKCHEIIACWRERLFSLSWMMKELNMSIAVKANKEDDCTGHFWEGRYKSQALLDEKALLAAMTYVDLNPVRAGIATTPEHSNHTSIKLRTLAVKTQVPERCLFEFTGNQAANSHQGLPFYLHDYLQWVDWVGKNICKPNSASIPSYELGILQRLGLEPHAFMSQCLAIEQRGRLWIGQKVQLTAAKSKLGKSRICGLVI
ncbi:transposase [Vibrio sp. CAIM 722]|uniref:Transposase n=1 Tax=Vibrio eleionomae TaxID=2653505 RepID=A0A7X4LL04_9VIBR|nr:transposase [Vibrio eleionomae]MZI93859.1 transposase [Vibrio eleionomae]